MQARRTTNKRVITVHANARAMAPQTRSALIRLGYELLRWDSNSTSDATTKPDLRIVDERRFDEIPEVSADNTPIIVLTGVRPLLAPDHQPDPRIVGRIARPAGLTPLYGLLQQGLEATPRRVPRVPTRLPARWIRSDKLSIGAILSLSERGCLLRAADQEIVRGVQMQLQFALPGAGLLSLGANSVHESGNDIGLCFHETSSSVRAAIGGFVSELLCSR